jgi:predicted amidohydrolase YtcJ
MTAAPAGASDIILHNAKVLTVDPTQPQAEALAIAGSRIAAVGSNDDVLNLRGPQTRTFDLGGLSVIPGFNDSHGHMGLIALRLMRVQLRQCRSIAELLEAIRERARVTPAGEWVVASHSWNKYKLAEQRVPTRAELDAAVPNHPVYVNHMGYTAILNSAALARAGYVDGMPQPEGGEIVRDSATGRLTGELVGIPAFRPVEELFPVPTAAAKVDALHGVIKMYNTWGITSHLDCGLAPGDMVGYQRLWERGDLTVRTSVMAGVDVTRPPEEITQGLANWGLRTGFGDDWLRIGGIKLFADGGIEGALQRQPYVGQPDYYGQHTMPPESIKHVVRWAAENDWVVGCHACGGAAGDLVLDIYEEVDREVGLVGKRFILFHAFFPSERNFEQIKRLGIEVSSQQTLMYNLGPNFAERWGWELTTRACPHRAWFDHGIPVGGGLDGTPFPMILNVWSCITRETDTAGVMGPEERITREEALQMHTLNSARLTREEHVKGSLTPGKFADLAVLGGDYLGCPEEDLRDLPVVLTIVGGKIVHNTFR